MQLAAHDGQLEGEDIAAVPRNQARLQDEDESLQAAAPDWEAAATDRTRQCNLLANALAEYSVDGLAAVTMPLLAVARDPRDAALLPDLARTVHGLGQAVEDNAVFLADALDACPGLREFVLSDSNAAEPTSERPKKRLRAHSQSTHHLEWSSPEREQHREDVRCVLKQLAREWSEDGAEERRRIHGPVLEALMKYVPPGRGSNPESTRAGSADRYRRGSNRLAALVADALNSSSTGPENADSGGGTKPLVLVPGSGLGRLACEIAGLVESADSASADSGGNSTTTRPEESGSGSGEGYEVEACESGAVMSAVAELFLGLSSQPREQQWRVRPFLHDAANRLAPTDQTRPVLVPDVPPSRICNASGTGCVRGTHPAGNSRTPSTSCAEFVSEYQRPEHHEQWDAVVTCFFLDTAKNPLDYILLVDADTAGNAARQAGTIAHCLKPGTGVWINSGPLLWHQSGNTPYDCLQLTQKELLRACELAGFQLLEEPRVLKNVPYCRDKTSLMRVEFDTVFWAHRKLAKDQR